MFGSVLSATPRSNTNFKLNQSFCCIYFDMYEIKTCAVKFNTKQLFSQLHCTKNEAFH